LTESKTNLRNQIDDLQKNLLLKERFIEDIKVELKIKYEKEHQTKNEQ
jgi:hypothetical protein